MCGVLAIERGGLSSYEEDLVRVVVEEIWSVESPPPDWLALAWKSLLEGRITEKRVIVSCDLECLTDVQNFLCELSDVFPELAFDIQFGNDAYRFFSRFSRALYFGFDSPVYYCIRPERTRVQLVAWLVSAGR